MMCGWSRAEAGGGHAGKSRAGVWGGSSRQGREGVSRAEAGGGALRILRVTLQGLL